MFTKISEFFGKIILQISNFQFVCSDPINPKKFPMNSIILLRNLSKNLFYQNTILPKSRPIGNGTKVLENFGEIRLKSVEKFKIINI